ncbi:MAG TPA: formate dehydrogenase accessory protein FdhE [Acidimicrobiia bacterium]|nr:formate dehydrogenase accessory protein FdhE [Acidimicrobiia bacterium]
MTFGTGARRGGPAAFAVRLARAEQLLAGPAGRGGAAAPLALAASVLRLQATRAAAPPVVVAAGAAAAGHELRNAAGHFPLLDLAATIPAIAAEVPLGVTALAPPGASGGERSRGTGAAGVPDPLLAAGRALAGGGDAERSALVESWLEDPSAPEPVLGFWVRVAAGPILETARAAVPTPGRDDWIGAACPACGGLAQLSVIAEESGEFMGGSPRSLVCGRCAGWWTFPRALCTWCSEADPGKLPSFVPDERRAVRIDGCETCGHYVKTFDLRDPGAAELVPLVDDVATVSLDLWARDQGLTRPLVSFAGV